MRLILLALCMLGFAQAAYAQSTAERVVPGYNSTATGFQPSIPSKSSLNITTGTNVKASPGTIGTVCLNTAAGTASSVIDSTGTSATAANTILTIPSTVTAGTCFALNWPAAVGISVVPGTNGVMSVSYQ